MNTKLFTSAFMLAIGFVAVASAQIPGNNPATHGNLLAVPGENRPIQRFAGNLGNPQFALAAQQRQANDGQAGLDQFSGLNWGFGSAAVLTPLGDQMRAASQIIRSTGEAVRHGSEAAINIETAKSHYLRNNYDAAKTFWEKRLLWAENTAYLRGPGLSSDQLRQIARDAAPDRLGVLQLSPATGEINWPAGLLRPEFASQRETLEEAFANRTVANAGPGTTLEIAATRLANAMQDELKSQIDDMTPTEYIVAKNFLRSLAYEARFAPGIEGIAGR